MDLTLVALAVLAGTALAIGWVVALRRDLDRRSGRAAEYDGLEGRGTLWTTAARCPECRASGALLAEEDGRLWHTCMSCGHRHTRDTRA